MPHPSPRRPVLTALLALVALLAGASLVVTPADAADRAADRAESGLADQTVDRAVVTRTATGPRLRVPAARLDRSLTCSGDPRRSTGRPVLLVPGTTLEPGVNFSWNYAKVFTEQGRAWCAVRLPAFATGDIQVAAEYVTHAIRTLHRRAGQKISVIGHSQGGMVPRWSLKFWPDTRAMVDDLVGLAPSNHGTILAPVVCAATCQPAIWQQAPRSAFLTTLNAGGETLDGISYTQVWSATDEVVVPNVPGVPGVPPSSRLTTGRGAISNIPVQSVCPVSVAEHLSVGTSDPVGYAAVVDALGHRGPAEAARLDRAVCTQGIFPGIDPVTFPLRAAELGTTAATSLALQPRTQAEPRLRAYAR